MPPQQHRAACLGDHRFGITFTQRQHAQREIAHHLDGDAAHAEGERKAEIRIARYAGKNLDAAPHEFLHQKRSIRRTWIERVEALV